MKSWFRILKDRLYHYSMVSLVFGFIIGKFNQSWSVLLLFMIIPILAWFVVVATMTEEYWKQTSNKAKEKKR